jgi:aspartate kinase
MKFGGSSLKDKNGFTQMVSILRKENTEPIVMVCSAFSSATRKLKEAALSAEASYYIEACQIIDSIISEHYYYCETLLESKLNQRSLKELFDSSSDRIKQFLKGISITEELTPRTLDILMSFGELFALHTIKAFLDEQGFDVVGIDSTKLICSDDNHGKAKPMIEESAKKIKNELLTLLKNNKIILTQGFVALSQKGEITTMGMESSNLTAVILASVLETMSLTFWTNVSGIRDIDPDYGFQTKNISRLSYDLAYKAARNGLKLIYPATIDIARKSNIKLIYRNCFEPEGEYTLINNDEIDISNPMIIVEQYILKCQISINDSDEESAANHYLSKVINNENLNPTIFRQSDSIMLLFHGANSRHAFFPNDIHYFTADGLSLITVIFNDSSIIRKSIQPDNDLVSINHFVDNKIVEMKYLTKTQNVKRILRSLIE